MTNDCIMRIIVSYTILAPHSLLNERPEQGDIFSKQNHIHLPSAPFILHVLVTQRPLPNLEVIHAALGGTFPLMLRIVLTTACTQIAINAKFTPYYNASKK
jgi:hypothetical protein